MKSSLLHRTREMMRIRHNTRRMNKQEKIKDTDDPSGEILRKIFVGGLSKDTNLGNGPIPVKYVNGVFNNRGRGYGRGGGRGCGYQGRGRGGYGGQIDYHQEAEFFDAPPLRYPIPIPSRDFNMVAVRSYEGGDKGGYGGQFDYQK